MAVGTRNGRPRGRPPGRPVRNWCGRAAGLRPRLATDGVGDAPRACPTRALFPELNLGPAAPAWPAAATTRSGEARLGLLRDLARVESLEARPDARFRLRVTASGFDSEWSWRLEPVAGGTRVIHAATFEPFDRWTGILVRFSRASLASRVEAHLRALKEHAEAAERGTNAPT